MSFSQASNRLLGGFANTLILFFITLSAAIPFGLVFTFGSMSSFKPLKSLTRAFVTVIRGTPLLLQLLVIMYVPGLLFNMPMRNRLLAASIAFVINYACYFSEIYRGGIEAVDSGQQEAATALGMSKILTFKFVILPQVIKNILPAMGNEVITLVKDTSLAQFIAYKELMLITWEMVSIHGVLWILLYAGGIYFLFNCAVTAILSKLEKRLNCY